MAHNVLLKEITQFKNEFAAGGMLVVDFIQKSKQIKNKIDIESEKSLNFFRWLLFLYRMYISLLFN